MAVELLQTALLLVLSFLAGGTLGCLAAHALKRRRG